PASGTTSFWSTILGLHGQLAAIKEHPDFRPEDFLRLQASHNTQRRAGVVGPPLETPLPLVPNSLGMSESFGPHSGELDGVVLSEDRADSFGRAIDGIERKIVEAGSSRELPPGETGELLVRGYSVMQGYYKRERGECFEPDGFFRTGDLCSITDDGHLFFHGRGGEMIKTSGANVSPREVELALLAYPDVAEAVVLGKPDRRNGENVIAVVVPQPGERLDPERLRRRLDAELSSYKIPKLFITDLLGEDLPRTDSGKVQKPLLLEMIAGRA
ncbi:MAG: fatty acid--CoA ligase family protein, partial [Gammaproteobacteria bacterium]|nr:fatty acid--CoA ligase family protein [Gammaproteobacteria bacterium]